MGDIYKRTRQIRYKIAALLQEGKTFEEAEDIALQGDSNKARKIKAWREGGVYPYGEKDTPESDSFLDDIDVIQIGSAAHTKAHIHTEHAAHRDWDNPVFVEKIKALVKESLKEQSTAMHTEHAQVKPSIKLWRTMKNCTPITLRIQTELLRRARLKLLEDYQGHMSLNHYIELTLWELVGEPKDLLEPEI